MTTFLVFAKAPIPGYAKTRLSPTYPPHDAAALAAAALLDTIDAVEGAATSRPVLSLAGSLDDAVCGRQIRLALRSWTVVPQVGRTFTRRLVVAHRDAASRGSGVVQIAMDTPQVTPAVLRQAATALDGSDVIIGPTVDGGWWLLGLRPGVDAAPLTTVEMFTTHTGRATAAAFENHGFRVLTVDELADVDTAQDAAIVAELAPETRFGRLMAQLAPRPGPADVMNFPSAGPPRQVVDVILPTLDEAAALPWVLTRMPAWCRAIVVDNGSTDGSADVAREHGAQVVVESRRGFGAACYAGLLAATSPVIAFMDADASLDPGDLQALCDPVLDGGVDLVLGARVSEPGAWPWHARQANRALAAQIRRRTQLALTDLGPMRVVGRQELLGLGLGDRGFAWPLEMVLEAARAEWRIAELPVRYRPRIGRSKVTGTIKGTLRAGRDMSRLLRENR